jgi:hypothetical protein
VRRFDPSTDPDVGAALKAAIEAGAPSWRIDHELVQATYEPDDELRPIILAGRLLVLAGAWRREGPRERDGHRDEIA